MARRTQPKSARTTQAALWSEADLVKSYSIMNRRRSLIRRLDHLLDDAANEQFQEAAVVLRDALESLRLALIKDMHRLQQQESERAD